MTSKAVAVIRKSQGDEEDVSLTQQRDRVPALADDLADDTERIDLGVHTGFSIHTKDVDEERIDGHPKIISLLENLRAGEYDHLVAWDDTRLARDQFYWELKRAALLGDCDLAFVQEPPEDELTFRVQRAVESDVKRREIEKSKAALRARARNGYDQGRPPFGLKYDDAGEFWVPDRESGDFSDAVDVIDLRENGESWRGIQGRTGVNKDTARSIYERREKYLEFA
ncbi:MAG: DNA invertase Pin-like site-specific DNA recombinase [Haloarculaceae archaeon]|jgi:DNA invertase Pin-like site-specific DNA recombinase